MIHQGAGMRGKRKHADLAYLDLDDQFDLSLSVALQMYKLSEFILPNCPSEYKTPHLGSESQHTLISFKFALSGFSLFMRCTFFLHELLRLRIRAVVNEDIC